jgi:hypothetical protein
MERKLIDIRRGLTRSETSRTLADLRSLGFALLSLALGVTGLGIQASYEFSDQQVFIISSLLMASMGLVVATLLADSWLFIQDVLVRRKRRCEIEI